MKRTERRQIVSKHMLAEVARILRLTPEERLREVGNAARFVAAARHAQATRAQGRKKLK